MTDAETNRSRFLETSRGERRAELWPRACGAMASRDELPGHFRALVDLRGSDETHSAETSGQIEKDLPRAGGAFRNALDLRPGGGDYEALKRVLLAFVSHCPRIGYVQSMHSIAAFLLLAGTGEEDAFWTLTTLVSEIVPGYFDEGMTGAKLDQRVFARALRELLPAVGLHVGAIGQDDVVPAVVGGTWLLSMFVNVLPTRVTMELWDEMFRTRHRAPLLAACVALCELEAQAVLATTEMGEAIELLQRCGESFRSTVESTSDIEPCDDAKCEKFIARVQELLNGELSPAKVDQRTSRERGRFRRPSDIDLPAATSNFAVVTDVEELYVGLRSSDLQAKLLESRDRRENGARAGVSLNDELGVIERAHESRGGQKRDQNPSLAPPDWCLSSQELDSVSAKVMAIETHAGSLVEHGEEVIESAKEIALRPVKSILTSKLQQKRKEIVALYGEFVSGVQAVDKTLEMKPDLSVFNTEGSYQKSMWHLWVDSLFEATIEQAEMLLELLRQISSELSWILHVYVGEKKPSDARTEGWEDLGEFNEPDAERLMASVQSHKNETENRLSEIRAMIKRTHEEATHDLPLFRKNLTMTTSNLKKELLAEEDAVNLWALSAENRNAMKRQMVEDKLGKASQELLEVYTRPGQSEVYDSETRSTSTRDYLEQSYVDEENRLQEALQAVKRLESTLTRRSNALERERQTAESVGAISSRTLSQTNASLLLVYQDGEWLEHELVTRASKEYLEDYERVATLVEELSSYSRTAAARILKEWCTFVGELTSQVMLEYVSVIDSSSRSISDTQAALAASVGHLHSASPLASPMVSMRQLHPSQASPPNNSIRSLTSQMEKLTDIAGTKLTNFVGKSLRKFSSSDQHHEGASGGVSTPSASTANDLAGSPSLLMSRAARLQATAKEDHAKLETRREKLLQHKTWLRERLVARGA